MSAEGKVVLLTYHYTDKDGCNGIRSQPDWTFLATQPRDPERPFGAYFTTIEPTSQNLRTLHKRIRVPKLKQEYVFCFQGRDGLRQHRGGTGRDRWIFYSPTDYQVAIERQQFTAATTDLGGQPE